MTPTELIYKEQYERIQKGMQYAASNGCLDIKTHSGKHKAVCAILIRNTTILSEIALLTKGINSALLIDHRIEANHHKRNLIYQCYDLLYPYHGGMSRLLESLLAKFTGDFIQPRILSELQKKKNEIERLTKEHFTYLKKLMRKIVSKEKASNNKQYEALKSISFNDVLRVSGGLLEPFIELNTLLVELLKHLNTSTNKYSGDNIGDEK